MFFLLFHRPHVCVYGWIVPAIYIPLFCAKLYLNVQSNAKDRRCGCFPLKHAVGWSLARCPSAATVVGSSRCVTKNSGYTARWFPFLTLHLYSYRYLVSIMVLFKYVSCLLRFCRRWTHCDWYLSIWVWFNHHLVIQLEVTWHFLRALNSSSVGESIPFLCVLKYDMYMVSFLLAICFWWCL